jgi:hypothetical protein
MRRRFGYANVVSTLALVLAMSGGAFAAGHYLINSTKQINPRVLRKLHGARGSRGAIGEIGPVGPQGVTGASGDKGEKGVRGEPGFSALSQLPSGRTESGDFALEMPALEPGERVSTAIPFSIPLSVPIVPANAMLEAEPHHCPGVGTAAAGYLCVYTSSVTDVKASSGLALNPEVAPTSPVSAGSGKFGALLSWEAAEQGTVVVTGTYSVTAP